MEKTYRRQAALTYLPIEDRSTSLTRISEALERIKKNIEVIIPDVRVVHKQDTAKLQVSTQNAIIKIEVNLVNRGVLSAPVTMELAQRAQHEFDAFAAVQVVPFGQLYGGKICAALDRQHPRDLFDVKYLLTNEGVTQEVKQGFLLCLIASDRPMNEVIMPKLQDQRSALVNQFEGMSDEVFSYAEYEATRVKLIETVHTALTDEDRTFLLSVKNLTPDWTIHDFERFPSIQWKLQNLRRLKETNPQKHLDHYEALRQKLRR